MSITSRSASRSGVSSVQGFAGHHPALVKWARVGWVAKGIVYSLMGVIALPLAFGGRNNGDEASQSGAVEKIARSSLGAIALWVVAVGLALYVLWRLVSIVLPAENTPKAWATRAGYFISALVYTALAWSAVSFARSRGTGESTEDSRVDEFTRDLMGHAGGRWIVGILGVALIAIGAYFAHRGVTASFRDELEPGGLGPLQSEHIVRFGQVGWCARGAVMALIGFFLVRATVLFSPDEAAGLDDALRELAEAPLGAVAVAAIGAGLIIFGAFCILSAPRQRLKSA